MLDLLKMLKVIQQNIQILHRHLIDDRAWFANHEQLGEYYDKVQSVLDDLCEISDALGIAEPMMTESLQSYEEINVIDRSIGDSYKLVKKYFDDIVAQMNRVKDVPADVTNKIQEYQYYFRKEAEFKLARAVK